MLIRIVLFMVLVLTALPAHAGERDVNVANALTMVQEQKAVAQSWEGRHSDLPYLALLNESETTINADWSYEETYHVRLKILSEAAKQLGQWPIYYNKA